MNIRRLWCWVVGHKYSEADLFLATIKASALNAAMLDFHIKCQRCDKEFT